MLKLLFLIAVIITGLTQAAQAQSIKISVSLNPAGDFVAESDQVTGQATEKPDGTIEALNITVPTKSLKSGISLRDEHMTEKYLQASRYPDLILKIAKGKEGKGIGILIVKGKESKISGVYTRNKDHLKAAFKLKLSDLEIKDINYKGIGVEDEVKVEVLVPLVKGTAAATAPATPKKSTTGKVVPVKAGTVAAPNPKTNTTRPTAPKPAVSPVAPKK